MSNPAPIHYDTHAHLDYPDFRSDFAAVLERAHAAGIAKIICIGTSLDSSRRAIALAEQHPALYAVAGWHPSDVTAAPPDIRPELRALTQHPKVVALGETGLDYYRLPSTRGGSAEDDDHYRRRQAELFTQQLEVAAETGLNVVIHQRGNCVDDTLRLLEPYADRVRGVFHCFAGDVPTLQRILTLGSIVSFTGILTFKNGQNVRDALAATPMDSFMLETDCPFLAPMPYRGKRCEPAYVREIATTAAQVKGCSLEALSAATCATAHRFFARLQNSER